MISQIVIPMHVYGPDENEIRLQTSETLLSIPNLPNLSQQITSLRVPLLLSFPS